MKIRKERKEKEKKLFFLMLIPYWWNIMFMYVFVCAHMWIGLCMPCHTCGSQTTVFENWFSPLDTRVLEDQSQVTKLGHKHLHQLRCLSGPWIYLYKWNLSENVSFFKTKILMEALSLYPLLKTSISIIFACFNFCIKLDTICEDSLHARH